MTKSPPKNLQSFVAGIGLLLMRGVLLWIAIPLSSLIWVLFMPVFLRKGVKIGQLLGWVDINLCALLERSVLRPFFSKPIEWVPLNKMSAVKHRLGIFDFS